MSSAKVTLKEIDLSTRAPRFEGVSAGIVLPARKGPVDQPVLITSEEDFIDTFGEPDLKLGVAHYSALAFLAQSSSLFVVRVHNGAKYAGLALGSVKSDDALTAVKAGLDSNKTYNFDTDAKSSGVLVSASPYKDANKISVSVKPSPDYKGAVILDVYEDQPDGSFLKVESHEITRKNFTTQKGNQTKIDLVLPLSKYIRFVDNPLNLSDTQEPEDFFVNKLYDFHLAKEPYTLKGEEKLQKAAAKGTAHGTIVFDDGVYWEYLGEEKTYGHTITPADFTKADTAKDWKVIKLNPARAYLSGGSDGDAIQTSHILKGWDKLSNPEEFQITCLLDGGFTDHAIHTQMAAIAKKRIHSFAYLSSDPRAEVNPTSRSIAVVNYRKEGLINSSYAALYSPHVKIYDKYNKTYVYAAPDGFAAGAQAYTARNNEMWVPAAGWDNGVLAVNGLQAVYTEGERDLLYQNGINPLRQAASKGIAIWGNKTLQAKPSALDRVNVRMLLIVIEPSAMEFLEAFEFKLNDTLTRLLVHDGLEAMMKNIKARGGVYDFKVVCDTTNNTPEVIDNNELYADLYVKPTKAAEFITFRTVITTTGANFNAVSLS